MAGGLHSSSTQHEMTERTANIYVKRAADEGEPVRSKLTDQNVSILNYPDPLKPRRQLNRCPQEVTSDMEARWLHMIKESEKRA
ncbi:unnamed protein product [Fusarium graminearum]|uniref:Chromosome 1, complete genome n=2 Tax=Gibberella zeae TaxID=5518 RepID=A0A0E0RMD6_GIBZE|nr:hypothetical protein FG05_30158 [Fusarium graminearum]CAF3552685.1 unnamed protein product [Fusarium graminearum]CAF3578563.1 unnamed protein product [Fusarium graminearum]CAF3628429.1 unnamed protein product [Fusarium graminearum]CAG1985363.1 unnamed protein product [Fusarium graminearum]